jgi:hypothetical protein
VVLPSWAPSIRTCKCQAFTEAAVNGRLVRIVMYFDVAPAAATGFWQISYPAILSVFGRARLHHAACSIPRATAVRPDSR